LRAFFEIDINHFDEQFLDRSFCRSDLVHSDCGCRHRQISQRGLGGGHVIATFNALWLQVTLAIAGWCLFAPALIDVFKKFLAA
jgi:hypothetical protein